MIRSVILGTGSYLPAKVLTNEDLTKLVDTSDDWIVQRTGIRERHIAADGELTSDLATAAATNALAAAGVNVDEIDLVLLATATPDRTFPSSAVEVQRKLGITHGFAFDLQAVCSGFVYALTVADSLLRTGLARQGAGDRRRYFFAPSRLERPYHLRSVWRWCRRGGARNGRRRGDHGPIAGCLPRASGPTGAMSTSFARMAALL